MDEDGNFVEYLTRIQREAYLQGAVDSLNSLSAGYAMLSSVQPDEDKKDMLNALSKQVGLMRDDIIENFKGLGVTLDG